MIGLEVIRYLAMSFACGAASVGAGLTGSGAEPLCALVLRMDKAKFRSGEPIPVVCEMKNLGVAPATIWLCGFWPNHHVVVTDEQGQEPDLTPYGVACRARFSRDVRDGNRPWTLVPGASFRDQPIDLARLYDLGPGSYRVVVIYDDNFAVGSDPMAFVVEE